ncbi:MAG: LacI family DNA-binding transcriptional regulator [Casimicrobiaceae bacterium]
MVRRRGRADGALRTTIGQVAALAAVSTATVSRVLNHPQSVRASLRDRVDGAVAQLGYLPNQTARALSSLHTGLVGVLAPSLAGTYPPVVEAVEQRLREAGYAMLLATSGGADEHAATLARAMAGREIEGLLLLGIQVPDTLGVLLAQRRIPYVLADAVGEVGAEGPVVGVDYALAGWTVGAYLLGLGHRRLAFCHRASPGDLRGEALLSGIRAALTDAGATPLAVWSLPACVSAAHGELRNWLAVEPPTALICADDLLAMEALRLCVALGVAVPARMSIVGCGDLPFARHAIPTLTTLRVPHTSIGRVAVEQLLAQFGGRSVTGQSFPAKLVVRQSSGPARAHRET